jgi:3-oxoacyl-[acyl-carrier-protein] synthase-1
MQRPFLGQGALRPARLDRAQREGAPVIPVYIAGRGLASALGPDLAHALETLRAGYPEPGSFEIAPDQPTPYFGMPPSDQDWPTRARRLVRAAAAECRLADVTAEHTVRRGALFIASTSFDMGIREHGDAFERDIAAFAEDVAGWLSWRGPVFTVCTACTSAVNAMLSAAALLGAGDADDALVLGLELANRFTVGGFHSMQLLSATAPQPLGAARRGLVLGEAVAALHLSRRRARWRLCGGANVVDSSDPAGAVADAVAAMARQALARSGLEAGQIDLVKLQAAGSPNNDATEFAGLRQVFGDLPPVLSLKHLLGHTLGASGAAEVALLTACIEAGVWRGPAYPLDAALPVAWAVRAPARLRHVLSIILGFGGGHAAVVLEDTEAS